MRILILFMWMLMELVVSILHLLLPQPLVKHIHLQAVKFILLPEFIKIQFQIPQAVIVLLILI